MGKRNGSRSNGTFSNFRTVRGKSSKKQYDFGTGPSRATYADVAVVSSVFIAIVLAVTWALS